MKQLIVADVSASSLTLLTSQQTPLSIFQMLMFHLGLVIPKLQSVGETSISLRAWFWKFIQHGLILLTSHYNISKDFCLTLLDFFPQDM